MNFPEISIHNKHLGYYSVNGIPFASKNEAAIYATATKQKLAWHFNDEVYNNYNWTIEPEQSLDELYDQRARQLREQYDYLILSYSGGSDTHNILTSFLRQGLLIDEVLVNVNDKINKIIVDDMSINSNWNYGAEYKLQIYPRLQEIKNSSPRTKITVVDTSDSIMESMKAAGDASWVIGKKEALNISAITRYNYLYFSEIRKKFDKDKKIATIVGVEKPLSYISNNKFFLVFSDKMANLTPIQQHFEEYTNAQTEYFYWHPSTVDMVCKQAHVIKKWLSVNPQYLKLWKPADKSEFYSTHRVIQPIIKNVIYSTWNKDWFQVEKDTMFWHGEIDAWWHKHYSNTKEYAVWKEGINHMANSAKDYVYKKNGVEDGLINFGKAYYIGDMPPAVPVNNEIIL
jgi:hypothetical protein